MVYWIYKHLIKSEEQYFVSFPTMEIEKSFRGNELLGLKALSLTELRYITKFQTVRRSSRNKFSFKDNLVQCQHIFLVSSLRN